MSSLQTQNTTTAACKYNGSTARSLTRGLIPDNAINKYPDLACDLDSPKFCHAVKQFQVDHMGETTRSADGKLGPMTWKNMLSNFEPVMSHDNYIVDAGRRISIGHDTSPYKVINFDQTEGYSLHEAGHFSAWANRDIDRIVMHWGGLDPKHLHAVMNVPDRKVSTHFGIGLLNGEAVVCQYIDLSHKTWHAGKFNTNSVGVDICQQPVYKWSSRYKDMGYDIKKIKNPTDRGNVNILSIEPRIAKATEAFVRDLLSILELKENAPEHHGVINDVTPYTLVGHHHLTGKKWDIACWWDDIFS